MVETAANKFFALVGTKMQEYIDIEVEQRVQERLADAVRLAVEKAVEAERSRILKLIAGDGGASHALNLRQLVTPASDAPKKEFAAPPKLGVAAAVRKALLILSPNSPGGLTKEAVHRHCFDVQRVNTTLETVHNTLKQFVKRGYAVRPAPARFAPGPKLLAAEQAGTEEVFE